MPTAPVEPDVEEYRLTAAGPRARRPPRRGHARGQDRARGRRGIVSSPRSRSPASAPSGSPGRTATRSPRRPIEVEVRTLDDGTWSTGRAWSTTTTTARTRTARRRGRAAGHRRALVGEVDQVQTRLRRPRPGARRPAARGDRARRGRRHRRESPEIDTDDGRQRDRRDASPAERDPDRPDADEARRRPLRRPRTPPSPDLLAARSGAPTSGCGTRARRATTRSTPGSCTTPSTPTTTRAPRCPGIIRSIYAYHAQTRGWSDIGYNFLVDKFGRIWEGRYGGVDRPVVGAHTLGLQRLLLRDVRDRQLRDRRAADGDGAGLRHAVRLEAVAARRRAAHQPAGRRPHVLDAIKGHRDAGSTACPGRYLYAKLRTIRSPPRARSRRAGPARELQSQTSAGSGYPDLVARRSADKRIVVHPHRRQRPLRYAAGDRT